MFANTNGYSHTNGHSPDTANFFLDSTPLHRAAANGHTEIGKALPVSALHHRNDQVQIRKDGQNITTVSGSEKTLEGFPIDPTKGDK